MIFEDHRLAMGKQGNVKKIVKPTAGRCDFSQRREFMALDREHLDIKEYRRRSVQTGPPQLEAFAVKAPFPHFQRNNTTPN